MDFSFANSLRNTCQIIPLQAFKDNYIWLIQLHNSWAVVDPGDAQPVLEALEQQAIIGEPAELEYILLTHRHGDHVNGVIALQQATGAKIYGPTKDPVPAVDQKLVGGDRLELPTIGLDLKILDLPGHTEGHIAYAGHALGIGPVLFCGDTLFSSGCGRVIEGMQAQFLHSLESLTQLEDRCLIYCGHEYTLSNLDFAHIVEPNNPAILSWQHKARLLRQHEQATVPTTLGHEKQVNPFLRCHLEVVQQAVSSHVGRLINDKLETFTLLRSWKNNFNLETANLGTAIHRRF